MLAYLDASAWTKRYTGELGWGIIDALFDEFAASADDELVSSAISRAETFAALVRFRNRTALSDAEFDGSLARIALDSNKLFWHPVVEEAFQRCLPLILRHNLNATDAAILWSLLNLQRQAQANDHQVWLVASDKRLLRAASEEGLPCLDLELSSLRAVHQLLATS